MAHTNLYIGLMSGTSADGVDAVLMDFNAQPILLAYASTPFSNALRKRIHDLCAPAANEIDRGGMLDVELGVVFSEAVLALLKTANVAAAKIAAIGSHGQTIRHRPPGNIQHPFSCQIGDPNTIACRTNITTVADFRRRDLALGGQGAPLVPAFHEAVFSHPEKNRAIVNIGGIANISYLAPAQATIGFDTGPGNNLMDQWIFRHKKQNFDLDGQWARSGDCQHELLTKMLAHPYLAKAAPKSTGREDFHLAWLDHLLTNFDASLSPVNVQATLLQFTVESIANQVELCAENHTPAELYICGGGALNGFLMERLKLRLPQQEVGTTSALGLDPQWVEAAAFAWLAKQTLAGLTGNLPAVTGASKASILGALYFK